jgi:MoaA/NifB/PqqE/SkfB family radical SAM enzyme
MMKLLKNAFNRRPVNSSTEIRLTRLCTQRCRQCRIYERTTSPPTLTPDRFALLAGRLREYGASIAFLSGGEPTMVPGIEHIMEEAKRTFPVAVTLVTNLYNTSAILHRVARAALSMNVNVQTSFDGIGPTADYLRGGVNVSDTVRGHMQWIAAEKTRLKSKSLLYANTVLNRVNLREIPRIIDTVQDCGWMSTTGIYHSLTTTSQHDDELRLTYSSKLEETVDYLVSHPNVYTLSSFLKGIPRFLEEKKRKRCLFLDQPVLGSRILVMENGSVYLCRGEPVGDLFSETLKDIFTGDTYRRRLEEYRRCPGCWTACYTQRSLMLKPENVKDAGDMMVTLLKLGLQKRRFHGLK